MGCPKNQVDAEFLAASLAKRGLMIVDEPEEADTVAVLTCGFTKEARAESSEEILKHSLLKKSGRLKKLLVAGCFSQIYPKEIREEIPEIDSIYGVGETESITKELSADSVSDGASTFDSKRLRLSYEPYSYLKIADGCDRSCSFCSIPSIKGELRSVDLEELISEAEELADEGVKELVLVAQDLTSYGRDIGMNFGLRDLVDRLCEIEPIEIIRLMYLFPESLSETFLEEIYSNEKVCKYFDLPLQHASSQVLKLMNRKGSPGKFLGQIQKIKNMYPRAVFRSSFIVGHPGESERDFEILLEFIESSRIDWITAFPFSLEEGTSSANLSGKVDREEIVDRLNEFSVAANELMECSRAARVGVKTRVLVESRDETGLVGRSYMEAPEVDGVIHILSDKVEENRFSVGEIIDCRISESSGLDLLGEPVC